MGNPNRFTVRRGGTGWGCLEMDVRYRLYFDYYFTSIWSLWIALDELRWISMGVLRGPVVGRRCRRHRPVLISTRVLDLLSRARSQSLTFPLDKFHRNCPLGKAQQNCRCLMWLVAIDEDWIRINLWAFLASGSHITETPPWPPLAEQHLRARFTSRNTTQD